jgi:tRNA A37 threonylcarbamoyladenosine modification protein TsaB
VLDAHKGEVYVAAFDLDEAGELEEVLAPFHAPPEQAAERLGQLAAGKSLWLAGGGVERYGERLTAPLSSWARRAPRFADAPRAVFLAHEAVRSFQLEGASDLDRLEPLYLRSSDAKLPAPRA